MFEFEYPYVFSLIFIFIFCEYYCKEKSATFYFPQSNMLEKSSSFFNLKILKYLILVLALLALASPIKKLNTVFIKNDGIDIVLSLDTSYSMKQRGFNLNNPNENRWNVISSIVKDFIQKRLNDNIALVVFGSSVMTASPLSFDKNAQMDILSYLDIGIVGNKTAMFDSLASAINILKSSKSKSKIIVLLSDGEDTASKIPISIIIKLAKKYKIKIYTILISNYKIPALEHISKQSMGKSYLATNSLILEKIYEDINYLEKSSLNKNKIVLKEYYYFYPLFFSILMLFFFLIIKNRF
ncbi:MAG: VWA domain-containing protein [Campylobacteraceae bacterium]|nr:VWA domain-containing protein [Campylobacteraceae bacterium]